MDRQNTPKNPVSVWKGQNFTLNQSNEGIDSFMILQQLNCYDTTSSEISKDKLKEIA